MGAMQGGQGGPRPTQKFGCVAGMGHNAFGPTNNWPVCSSILRKISKIGSTRCHILRLQCTKFAFRWGSAGLLLMGGRKMGEELRRGEKRKGEGRKEEMDGGI